MRLTFLPNSPVSSITIRDAALLAALDIGTSPNGSLSANDIAPYVRGQDSNPATSDTAATFGFPDWKDAYEVLGVPPTGAVAKAAKRMEDLLSKGANAKDIRIDRERRTLEGDLVAEETWLDVISLSRWLGDRTSKVAFALLHDFMDNERILMDCIEYLVKQWRSRQRLGIAMPSRGLDQSDDDWPGMAKPTPDVRTILFRDIATEDGFLLDPSLTEANRRLIAELRLENARLREALAGRDQASEVTGIPEKIHPRRQNNLRKVIAALVKMVDTKDTRQYYKLAGAVVAQVENQGRTVSTETVANILREAVEDEPN
jgi:hypothetical protein